mmetsp:Transcript_751/g.1572  ORF Transcript_751/g.1572 Transcript_751/m.1572 type:complete len:285 (-) Transcript_751:2057-2911(-)
MNSKGTRASRLRYSRMCFSYDLPSMIQRPRIHSDGTKSCAHRRISPIERFRVYPTGNLELPRTSSQSPPPPGGNGRGRPSRWDPEEDGNEDRQSSFGLVEFYLTLQRNHPMVTKAATTGFLMAISDVIAQWITDIRARSDRSSFSSLSSSSRFKWLQRRTAAIGIYGSMVLGPLLHVWYGALDRLYPGGGLRAVLRQVTTDQLVMALAAQALFLTITPILEGKTWRQTKDSIRQHFIPGMLLNWRIWPAAQLINFGMLPRQFQIVFVNMTGMVYTVLLSILSHD